MNKFSISRLETARINPSAFANTLKANVSTFGGRFSKHSAWLLAIFEYHKKKGNVSQAIKYFTATYIKNFADNPANQRDLDERTLFLQDYVNEFKRKKLIYIEHKKRIEIILSPILKITGEVPIVSMNNKSGYSAYFFTKEQISWEDELRFPIIQNYIADEVYGVPISEVEVGVYDEEQKKLFLKIYSQDDLNEAIKELNGIGKIMTRVLK